MSPKPDVSEERKLQIIEAAVSVFAREGFNKARMDDIADKAGLSKGALYWYFKSKDAIISAILDSLFDREISRIRKMVDVDLPAREMLEVYINSVTEDIVAMKPIMPILYEFIAMGFRQKSIQKSMQRYLRGFMEVAEPLIQRGIDKGDFIDVDPTKASHTLGALIEGSIILWSYDPENIDVKEVIESSFNLVLEGLEKK
jgi:AcrR family transcriptional regulator